ncbi:Hypothetical predicted protein [Mytilus galloprovincialis]|uniref:CCHC-type domain-containing protein n=1 Tax=Mytilus galloprovincialis TaxID=29158 RepID=A0A8B6GDY1_MYTGA|nr:Hypothetical predicted protein [Mytilus galloprovincialis]
MSDNEKNPNEDMDEDLVEDTVGEEVSNADLLSLMKTYMNNKIAGLEKNLNDSTHSLAKKVKKSENNFKFKGNKVQFDLNVDVLDNLDSAISCIEKKRPNKAISYLEDSKELLNKRNKHIRIADKSEGGWQTVSEYLSDELASDSEDEKRIRAADSRAVKKLKAAKTEKQQHGRKRPAEAAGSSYQQAHSGGNSGGNGLQLQPFRAGASAGGAQGQQSPAKPSDVCYKCGFYGHWARECRRQSKNRVPRAPPS